MIQIIPTGRALGAEVRGVDLSGPVSDATFRAINDAWMQHCVLLFRGQSLNDPQQVAFSRRFGDLDLCPPNDLGRVHVPEAPEIVIISNVLEKGERIGSLGNYESKWHTDMSFQEIPPRASLLYSIEVPPSGGDTGFSNMYMAYETLPPDLMKAVQGRKAIHDATYDSVGNVRKGLIEVDDVRKAPGAHHPLVRLHPVTKRPALFLGRRKNAYVPGLSVAESDRLLDALWAHATQARFTWMHQWKTGDLVLWDNRCTLHRRDAFDNAARRVMHRTQVKGETVLAAQ
jgi:taurine dioxygenase